MLFEMTVFHDNDSQKQGQSVDGVRVLNRETIKEGKLTDPIICAARNREHIAFMDDFLFSIGFPAAYFAIGRLADGKFSIHEAS